MLHRRCRRRRIFVDCFEIFVALREIGSDAYHRINPMIWCHFRTLLLANDLKHDTPTHGAVCLFRSTVFESH